MIIIHPKMILFYWAHTEIDTQMFEGIAIRRTVDFVRISQWYSRSHVYLHNKQTRVPYDVGNKIKG